MVLNGYNGAPSYATEHAFTYVERPRMVDNSQHNTNVNTFTDTLPVVGAILIALVGDGVQDVSLGGALPLATATWLRTPTLCMTRTTSSSAP